MVTNYTRTAIWLHWLIALGLAAVLAAGVILDDLDDPAQHAQALNFHRSLGLTLFGLTLFRLIWRLIHQPPEAPPMTKLQALSAKSVHILLYAAMFAMPVTGYLASVLRGRAVMFWGLGPIPDFIGPDKPLARLFNNIHGLGQYVIYALLLGHVGAALYHQFILKDRLLARMGLGPAPNQARQYDRDQTGA